MLRPSLRARMEQGNNQPRLRIDSRQVRALVQITMMTSQREIRRVGRAAVLSWNNVLDVVSGELALAHPAVFATTSGALPNESAQCVIHNAFDPIMPAICHARSSEPPPAGSKRCCTPSPVPGIRTTPAEKVDLRCFGPPGRPVAVVVFRRRAPWKCVPRPQASGCAKEAGECDRATIVESQHGFYRQEQIISRRIGESNKPSPAAARRRWIPSVGSASGRPPGNCRPCRSRRRRLLPSTCRAARPSARLRWGGH